MKRIAISLESICTPISNTIAEEEVKECKIRHLAIPEYIQDLKSAGNYIIIYTTRNPVLVLATKDWLRKESIIYDELIFVTKKVDIYLDNNLEIQKIFPEGQKGR
jgi:uncharacterized HAD superfamily protein